MKNHLFKIGRSTLVATALYASLLSGCGDSENFVFTNTQGGGNVAPGGQAPIAVNDTITALGNATLNQAAANGVLTNDTVNNATITSFDATTTAGGTVDLQADGSFTYTPEFEFTGNDSFTYTLSNSEGDSTATVTLNVPNSGYFVDNSAATNGNGSQASPFDNLADALAAAESGDIVYVSRGDGSVVAANFTIPEGVSLIGEGEGLVLGQTIEPAGQRPLLDGPITFEGGNAIVGFVFDNTGSDLFLANGVSSLTVRNNLFQGGGSECFNFDNLSGGIDITANIFETDGYQRFIDLRQEDTGSVTVSIVGNTFNDTDTDLLEDVVRVLATGTGQMSLDFSNNTVNNIAPNEGIDDMFELDANDTTMTTFTADGNTCNDVRGNAFDLDVDGSATINATLTSNTVDTTGSYGFRLNLGPTDSSYTVTQNVITNAGDDGIRCNADDSGNVGTYTVSNNNITNSDDDGIHVFASSASANDQVIALLNDNTITGSDDASIFITQASNGATCAQITGNTVNDSMVFEQTGGTLDVEQFDQEDGGPLDDPAVNTFNSGDVVVSTGTVTSQEAGYCSTL